MSGSVKGRMFAQEKKSISNFPQSEVIESTPIVTFKEIKTIKQLASQVGPEHINAKNTNGNTACDLATQHKHMVVVELLTPKTCFMPVCVTTPLYVAASHGRAEVASQLMTVLDAKQIDIDNSDDNNILHLAAEYGDIDMVRSLLVEMIAGQVNAKNKNGNTALHLAVLNGHTDIVRLLIDKLDAAQINAADNIGGSTLHMAVATRCDDIAELLINKLDATQMNPPNKQGATVLHLAAFHGRSNVVALLISKLDAAQINTSAMHEVAALHVAIMRHKKEVVEILAESPKVDINAFCEGETALHFAAKNSNPETVAALLGNEKIDVLLLDSKGETALQCALAKKQLNSKVVEMLRSKEAEARKKVSALSSSEHGQAKSQASSPPPIGGEKPKESKAMGWGKAAFHQPSPVLSPKNLKKRTQSVHESGGLGLYLGGCAPGR